jgi:hypothetical protein
VRDRLPEPSSYFESEGLVLQGRGKWRTAQCDFHGGSDSMRVNLESGAWVCMAGCGAKGGDVVAYHQASHGVGFVDAAKALGAWEDDGKQAHRTRPTQFPARDALEVLKFEAMLVAVAAGNVAQGVELTDEDLERLSVSAARVQFIADGVLG